MPAPGPRSTAACGDLPQHAVFATGYEQALPALLACTACGIRDACRTAVDPERSWFDGVCDGRLWRNGRPVAESPPPAAEPV